MDNNKTETIITKQLELSSKLVAVSAGLIFILYIVGFFITSSYFMILKIPAFEIIKTRYLTAGACYLLHLLMWYSPFVFLWFSKYTELAKTKLSKFSLYFFWFWLLLVCLFSIWYAFDRNILGAVIGSKKMLLTAITTLAIVYSVPLLFYVSRKAKKVQFMWVVGGASYALMIAAPLAFGSSYYSAAAPAIGGALSRDVRIVLKHVEALSEIGSTHQPIPKILDAKLVDISESGYVLFLKNRGLLEVRKDMVDAIWYSWDDKGKNSN